MQIMKKLLAALAALLVFTLAFSLLGDAAGPFALPRAHMVVGTKIPILQTTPIPRLPLLPRPTLRIPFPRITPAPTPATTATPQPKQGAGKYMTSEGPLFLSFRPDLTQRDYMFTPMDLSVDGEFAFPLIGSTKQVVGEVKVVVLNGKVTVSYLVENGVKVSRANEFFTFFADIGSIRSLKVSKLQKVKLRFNVPYQVAKWLKSDSKVLLYVNCPLSYDSKHGGFTPFSLEDPDYLERVEQLLPLMD